MLVSSLTHDLWLGEPSDEGLVKRSRIVIVLVSLVSILAAIYGPPEIFSFVLFAWSAMGAAFGPLLLVTVLRGRVSPPFTLAAMVSGFVLSVGAYLLPATHGGFIERVVPFAVALAIALRGSSPAQR